MTSTQPTYCGCASYELGSSVFQVAIVQGCCHACSPRLIFILFQCHTERKAMLHQLRMAWCRTIGKGPWANAIGKRNESTRLSLMLIPVEEGCLTHAL